MPKPQHRDQDEALPDFMQLSLSSLAYLDFGKTVLAADEAIRLVAHDLYNRPTDSRPRTVTLTMRFVPKADTDPDTRQTDCVGAKFSAIVKTSIPGMETPPCDLGMRGTDKSPKRLFFSTSTPANARQPGLPFDDDDQAAG